jgi:hypothetical protein
MGGSLFLFFFSALSGIYFFLVISFFSLPSPSEVLFLKTFFLKRNFLRELQKNYIPFFFFFFFSFTRLGRGE